MPKVSQEKGGDERVLGWGEVSQNLSPDIMKTMRLWLDQRRFEPKTFEYVISGSGVLVRLEFPGNAEAAEFAEAFGGEVSGERPSIDGVEVNPAERSLSGAP